MSIVKSLGSVLGASLQIADRAGAPRRPVGKAARKYLYSLIPVLRANAGSGDGSAMPATRSDFVGKLLGRRSVGYRMDEVMTGFHEFAPGQGAPGRRPMEFRVTWAAPDVTQTLNPASGDFLRHELFGEVSVDGLCEAAPCRGTLDLRYFRDQSIRYTFDFTVEGRSFHYVGDKVNILPWNLPWSHTTCFGRLTDNDTGALVSSSVTFFRMRTALDFLRSFRLTTGS